MSKLTLEEVKQGWASGPFAEQELDDRLGRGWVPSHRFGLVSAGKFRLIDFSGSLVNATVTCKEQVLRGTRHSDFCDMVGSLENATIWRPRTSSVHWRMRKIWLVL